MISIYKSRVQWLKEGEINSKLLHNSMLQWCLNNRIFPIIGADEERKILHPKIEYEFVAYYHGIMLENSLTR